MSIVQERIQTKREPLDKWSLREKLCLASAVAKSGDQNWISVSRVLKPFADPNRPIDWFHQKNCAVQYSWLLETIDTPKRKKREAGCETPIEVILRKLTQERLAEVEKCIIEEKAEYLKMQEDMAQLKSGNVTMEMLNKWCREIDEENKRQEEEAAAHSQWLREREARKQEVERNMRPMAKPPTVGLSLKRKASDALEPEEESSKPALSPLLTSLLKSPSQNITANATVLNTSIGGATAKSNQPTTNPTIASILNSPHALQQLVLQDPISLASDMLEDTVDSLPNLKVDDLESSLLSSDSPLPVMKNEEVEVIISNLIQSNVDEDLKLDDVNADIITNLQHELEEYCKQEEKNAAAAAKMMDPFEFREDPAICAVLKQNNFNGNSVASFDKMLDNKADNINIIPGSQFVTEQVCTDEKYPDKELTSGSVEILEVVVMNEPEMNKQMDKTQIQDIVHSIMMPQITEIPSVVVSEAVLESLDDIKLDTPSSVEQPHSQSSTVTSTDLEEAVMISDDNSNDKIHDPSKDAVFEDIMKVTKHHDASKRDYSRKRKDPEKEFDMLIASEKSGNSELNTPTTLEFNSNQVENSKKNKIDADRSNSPWTEEEDAIMRSKRRYSAPATPIDSFPTSPASSGPYYEDDREYRNWKKSVLLVYGRLTTHKYASLFLKPITEEQAPNYHSLVYRPIDLQTIRRNIDNGTIRTNLELRRAVLLMFTNAIMYNKTYKVVYDMAQYMQLECMQHLDILLHAQQGDVQQRRETRTSEPASKRKRPPEENTRNKKRKED